MSNNIKQYWVLLLPVLVMAVGLMIFKMMTFDEVAISVGELSADKLINDTTVGYPYWLVTSFLLLFLTSVAAVVFTVRDVSLHNNNGPRVTFYWISILLFTVIFIGIINFVPDNLYAFLGIGVFDKTVGAYLISVGYDVQPETCKALCPLKTLIDWSNALAVGAATVIVCGIATLQPSRSLPPKNTSAPELQNWIDQELNAVAGRMKRLKYLLLAATAVLVSGVVFMTVWRGWPNIFNFAGKNIYKQLADASVQFQAFHFAIILAAIFVPMAVVLKQRANDVAFVDPGLSSDKARKTFLLERGASFDFKAQATQVLAILSPYLVSGPIPILDYINIIKNVF